MALFESSSKAMSAEVQELKGRVSSLQAKLAERETSPVINNNTEAKTNANTSLSDATREELMQAQNQVRAACGACRDNDKMVHL